MRIAILAAALLLAPAARAEVTAAAPDGFVVTHTRTIAASPLATWRALTAVARWWNGAHSYSRDARNLTLLPRAGGCFCERWDRGEVVHGRVAMAIAPRMLRLETALGPLQELGPSGALTFAIAPAEGGVTLTAVYRVNGSSLSGLDRMAGPVDTVLGEQVDRLKRYLETGAPD